MKKVLIITTGFSSFVADMIFCKKFSVTGILDCQSSVELKSFANENGISYKALNKQNTELIQWIRAHKPEVMAVYKMPFLLTKEIFSIPEYGSINIHPSFLPAYRGPNPWFWIYYNMENESGVTVHFIDAGEDTGNIIYQERFSIALGERLIDLKMKATTIGTNLMIKAICNIEHIRSTPQPALSPTVRARNVFNYQGLINWEKWSVEKIWHLLNGFPEILQTNKSYIKLNKTLIPDSYCFGNKGFLVGELTLADNHYILGCINGSIEFRCW